MDDSCLICTEDFNDSKHAIVSCSYCQFAACRTCCQHYILDQEASVCMNKTKKSDGTYICQKEWSRKFVTDNFPRTWVNNEWKQMNSKVCVEREKALLPSSSKLHQGAVSSLLKRSAEDEHVLMTHVVGFLVANGSVDYVINGLVLTVMLSRELDVTQPIHVILTLLLQ